jgi:hypothetical protein
MDVNKPKVRDLCSVQVLVNGQKRVTLNTVKSARCSMPEHLDFLLSEFQHKVLAVDNSVRFNVASDSSLNDETLKRIFEVVFVIPYEQDAEWGHSILDACTGALALNSAARGSSNNRVVAAPAQVETRSAEPKKSNRREIDQVRVASPAACVPRTCLQLTTLRIE